MQPMKPKPLRARVRRLLDPPMDAEGERGARIVSTALVWLIVLNVVGMMLETVDSIRATWGDALHAFEVASVAVFTAEYVLRVWSCAEDERYGRPVSGRLRFAATPLALIDLLAILPFFLERFTAVDLRVLRIPRLLRILRLLKLVRYSRSLRTLGNVFVARRDELLISLVLVFVLVVMSASIVYVAEHDAQPEAFSSIPAVMWWAVATLTTVGYGDMAPITPIGQLLGSFIAVLGIGMVALPAGILGSGFTDELARLRDEKELQRRQRAGHDHPTCPTCGQDLPSEDRDVA